METSSKPSIPRQQSLILPEVLNPFKHRLKLDWYDFLKIGLMTITVFPVRCMMILLIALLAWPLAYIGLAGRKDEEKDEPITGWRRWFISSALVLQGRLLYFVMGFHRIKVTGQLATAEQAPILVCGPHTSFFDAIVMFVTGIPSPVARDNQAKTPMMGTLIKYTQPVFVSREDPNSRFNTIKEILNRAQSGKWPQIIIFPEGTCTNRSALITFKQGAFYPGVPVQPVLLRYPNRTDSVTWTWDGPGVAKALWLTLCQFQNYLEVEYLPVYTPSEEEKKDAHLFAKNVRQVMASKLGVPATEHTFDDCRLMIYAQKHNIPMSSGLIEFNKLTRKLGLKFDNAKQMMEEFTKISPAGLITLEQFAAYLHLPVSDAVIDLFNLYDRDQSGTIDFREYIIGLSLVSMPACTEGTLELAFQLFDLKKDGHITLDELLQILHRAFNLDHRQVARVFREVDADRDGKISFDEFKAYAKKRPEYAKLFITYQQQLSNAKSSAKPGRNGRHGNKSNNSSHSNLAASCHQTAGNLGTPIPTAVRVFDKPKLE